MNRLGYPSPAFAVIGLSGRFPGARNPAELWANLAAGVESITRLNDDELLAAGESRELLDDPSYVKASGKLDAIDQFDAAFFGLSPRDAAVFDPQHRLFLEAAWEAFENAGYHAERFDGPIGVFASCGGAEYLMHNLLPNRQVMESVGAWLVRHTGNDQNFLATRVSYELNLNGPSLNVQSACSSSLVAVHLACQSLLNGECDMALAGGATVYPEQNRGYLYKEGEILSPDGHCRAFDAASAGTVMSSAVGCVILRRLEDAVRDGDQILAIVRGSAVNNDGSHKVGYLAPSVSGQARVVTEALAIAGIDPAEVSYIEAHGTGTLIGDPIEVTALTQAFRAGTDRTQFCAIGSLKTNIGHTGEASGICGFIKTVLALQHRQIPPSLHFESPNPQIDFASSPFVVNTRLREWTVGAGQARIAGVTSLGAGGTNVHVLVEEAPDPAVSENGSERPQLLLLSGRTPSALDEATRNLAEHLRTQPGVSLADAAFTLMAGRKHFAHRRALVAQDVQDALTALAATDQQRLITHHAQLDHGAGVVFMFPGGGAQYARMGAGLYTAEPTYRAAFDEALSHLDPTLRTELRQLALGRTADAEAASACLEAPSRALPALLATEYAIARLLSSWGIEPEAMLGHSAGEYTAACLAGVISLREAMNLVALRGRLFERLGEGGMLSVPLAADEVLPLLEDDLSIAAINASRQCVVSGPLAAIARAEEQLRAREVDSARVRIKVAAHSAMVEPILADFERFCRTIAFNTPRIPFISNVTGTWITDAEARDPGYWVAHLRGTVRFADGVEKLIKHGSGIFFEVGPGRTLSSLVRQQPTRVAACTPTVRHVTEAESDVAFLLAAVGRAWAAGLPLDAARLLPGPNRRIALPTYPFERQRFWVEPDRAAPPETATPVLRKSADLGEWFYAPSWARSAPPPAPKQPERQTWLVLTDDSAMATALTERLRAAGQSVTEVIAGRGYRQLGEQRFAVDPASHADFDALAAELTRRDALPRRVVHLWALSDGARNGGLWPRLRGSDVLRSYQADLARHYLSLVHLAQAVAGHLDALRLISVSSNLQALPGDAHAEPEKAIVLGALKVIPREYPQVSCVNIDLAWPSGHTEPNQIVERLWPELVGDRAETEVVLRGTDRWVRRFDAVRLEPADGRPWLRDGGVYVVTGGLGGIGLRLAEHLGRNGRSVKLALIGRTPLPTDDQAAGYLSSHGAADETSRRLNAVAAIRASGAEVVTVAADVADFQAMRTALGKVRARFGAIDGVFHAAGVLHDELIALREDQYRSAVIDSKMRGALILDRLLSSDPPELFVVFSSVSGILGLPGQADYTAANAFLDAFAHARAQRRPGRTLSIDWNAWQEVGMLAARRTATPHPALGEVLSDSAGTTVFQTSFRRSDSWLLSEHVVRGGDALIPGSGFLEIARAALEYHPQPRSVELRGVTFLAPFTVGPDESRSLHVRLQRDGDHEFVCYAESVHEPLVIGQAEYVDSAPPPSVDLDAIRARCQTPGAVEDGCLVQQFMEFGPRWSSLQGIDLGDHEALVRLELPAAFGSDVGTYLLHPALLDLATGGAQALVPGFDVRQTFYVPFSYGRVLVRRPLPRQIVSHIRVRDGSSIEAVTFDVRVYDETGQELVAIDAFTMRRAAASFTASAARGGRRNQVAARPTDQAVTATETAIREGMTPSEGLEALDRILAVDFSPQVVACTVPLHAWLERLTAESRGPVVDAARPPIDGAETGFARPSAAATSYTPPRDDVEQQLAGMWSSLLGIRDVGVHDDFFELGGQSLIAVRLFARIKKAFGVDLPLATLFQAPTIAACAALINEARRPPQSPTVNASGGSGASPPNGHPPRGAFRSLVVLEPGQGGTPFFCVHGAGGNILNLRDLARAMDPRQPVCGLQAYGVDDLAEPHKTIEDMAAAYLAEIRELQPHGPYLLGGYSGGGVVAFEMAHQLTAAGERVGLLALIDSFHPKIPVRPAQNVKLQRLRGEGMTYVRGILSRRRITFLRWPIGHAIARRLLGTEPFAIRELRISHNFGQAVARYQMKPWSGTAMLFRATDNYFVHDSNATYGWDREILGGVEVVMVPGSHETLLLGANARFLVASLNEAIDRAVRRTSVTSLGTSTTMAPPGSFETDADLALTSPRG